MTDGILSSIDMKDANRLVLDRKLNGWDHWGSFQGRGINSQRACVEQVAACEAVLVRLLDTAEARLSTGGAAAAPTAATAAGTTGDQQQQEERFLGGPAYSIADAMFTPIL